MTIRIWTISVTLIFSRSALHKCVRTQPMIYASPKGLDHAIVMSSLYLCSEKRLQRPRWTNPIVDQAKKSIHGQLMYGKLYIVLSIYRNSDLTNWKPSTRPFSEVTCFASCQRVEAKACATSFQQSLSQVKLEGSQLSYHH